MKSDLKELERIENQDCKCISNVWEMHDKFIASK